MAVKTLITRQKIQPFTTRAAWEKHVKDSGGVVTVIPSGEYKGLLGARYGGAGTRYPNMAPMYDVAPDALLKVQAAAIAADDSDIEAGRKLQAIQDAINSGASAAGTALNKLLPPWAKWALGVGIAAAIAEGVRGFMPRRG
jgi:hypothetical protein